MKCHTFFRIFFINNGFQERNKKLSVFSFFMNIGYYEAIIQVRPRKSEIEKFIESSLKDTHKADLSKKKRTKGGIDYYISSWKYASALGNLLVKRFGGKLTLSKKIFGKSKKKGRVVYRASILYRIFPFNKGDILACDEKVVSITSIGKKIVGKNLMNGKKRTVDQKKGYEILEKNKTVISKTHPNLEVINPEDYQSVSVQNPRKVLSNKVEVVIYKGKVYLID
tara:strand:- start:23356 stop:24027 length:672 start_codon:yes stop_codon:yes gene_type:complete